MASTADKPGLTLASFAAMVLGLLVTSILVQFFDVVVMTAVPAEYTLALPAIWAFLGISAICGAGWLTTKVRWLSKQELLCVLFVMLMAAPLMTQAFWHRVVAVTATSPRLGDLDKLASTNDRLWPHGPDVLAGRIAAGADTAEFRGPGTVTWETFDLGAKRSANGPAVTNAEGAGESVVRLKLPVVAEGEAGGVTPGSPCLISVLFRATSLAPDSVAFVRIGGQGVDNVTDVARSSEGPKITFQDPTGFRRMGAYNIRFPVASRETCWVDIGLVGKGRLEIAGASLMDVSTLEGVFRGRREVTRAVWETLSEGERVGLLVRPDNMWSWEGLKYFASGYVPWRDWWRPLTVWGLFILLVLGACLCVNLIFRRQWIDNERNLLPVAQIPAAMAGVSLGGDPAEWPWYRSKLAWIGFVVGMAWLLGRAWHTYNPAVPDLTVNIKLKDWFTHPGWGGFGEHAYFTAHPCLIALCGFMELSMLISLVIGFFAYRAQSIVGAQTGWSSIPNYPFEAQQQLASFLAYAVGVLWIARRHLVRVGRAVIFGPSPSDGEEPVSYRWSVGVLLLCMLGGLAWAWWLGMSVVGFAAFFGLLIAVGLVSSKIRAEFGTPWGYFAPSNFAMLLLLLGGVQAFGPDAVLFCYIASFMLSPTVFYLIPGAQLEFLELGRRAGVRAWHVPAVCVLAVVGGMIFGGWAFLSNSYALGGETFRYTWAYDAKPWYFFTYNQEMARATTAMTAPVADTSTSWFTPERWAYIYSSTVTIVLVGLRQLWQGFALHPAGFVLGMTGMAAYTWGSALTAWVIRGSVVYFGGAVAVRRSLTPFLIGLFIGGALAELLIGVDAAFRRAAGSETVFGSIFPP